MTSMTSIIEGNNCRVTLGTTVEEGDSCSGLKNVRALPRVLAKGPLKAYRGTIHKTKAPPTTL
jgi:hypothetical protein